MIKHYQNTTIQPFGERLSESYIKFSEMNQLDSIQPSHMKYEDAVSQIKTSAQKNSKGAVQNGQRKKSVPIEEDITPPIPDRIKVVNDNYNGQIYSTINKEVNEGLYVNSKKTDILYSVIKEAQFNHMNMAQASTPDILYSEVKLDHNIPAALRHLKSSIHSAGKEGMKLPVDTRTPKLLSSLKDLSECEVVEMRFATAVQTVNSKTVTAPILRGRGEIPGNAFVYCNVTDPEVEETYEQIPFRGLHSTNNYETVDQTSSYSMSCMYDHISTRTCKEVTSREVNKKVAVASDNDYEIVCRDVSKPAGRKPNVAKNDKTKRFLFGDKKK
ncbi:uncharacterized protein [Hyperolius riggenbachi]|uniref:uncharacterized protein n=1 Tax=Hyperolius riggenbachi TaxID=752182 RepID=UPI0035A37E4B